MLFTCKWPKCKHTYICTRTKNPLHPHPPPPPPPTTETLTRFRMAGYIFGGFRPDAFSSRRGRDTSERATAAASRQSTPMKGPVSVCRPGRESSHHHCVRELYRSQSLDIVRSSAGHRRHGSLFESAVKVRAQSQGSKHIFHAPMAFFFLFFFPISQQNCKTVNGLHSDERTSQPPKKPANRLNHQSSSPRHVSINEHVW